MTKKDEFAIAITDDASLRIYASITTELVKKAQAIHKTYPVATAALGRVLTAGVMMGAMEKIPHTKITIQIKGGGPLGPILAVAEPDCTVRGYVSIPDVYIPHKADGKLDVGTAVGKDGYLSVIKDYGTNEPYTGHVELVSGEIAEDLTYYYATSEQTPTAIALGVLIDTDFKPKAAGGYVIQLMPGFGYDDEKIIDKIENKIKQLPPVSQMVDEGCSTKDIIKNILDDTKFNILKTGTPKYQCNCSKKRVEKALISIGKEELQKMIDEDNGADVNCNFCDNKYYFTTEDLKGLLKK